MRLVPSRWTVEAVILDSLSLLYVAHCWAGTLMCNLREMPFSSNHVLSDFCCLTAVFTSTQQHSMSSRVAVCGYFILKNN